MLLVVLFVFGSAGRARRLPDRALQSCARVALGGVEMFHEGPAHRHGRRAELFLERRFELGTAGFLDICIACRYTTP